MHRPINPPEEVDETASPYDLFISSKHFGSQLGVLRGEAARVGWYLSQINIPIMVRKLMTNIIQVLPLLFISDGDYESVVSGNIIGLGGR